MKYGMPCLLEFNTILENVELAKDNGLDFVELNMDLPYCQNINNISKYNFCFTMHLSEKLNLAELNNHLRKSYLDEAIRQINLGIKNEIKRYSIHIDSGIYFTLPEGKVYLNEKYIDIYKDNFDKSCKLLNKIANNHNIYINFENTKIHNFTKEAINIIKKYDNLGFTLDIGHNEKNENKAYPLFLKTNKIRHIHLHDYDGKKDHLTIGKGTINISKYKNVLNNNYVVIEVKKKKELIDSINYLIKFKYFN